MPDVSPTLSTMGGSVPIPEELIKALPQGKKKHPAPAEPASQTEDFSLSAESGIEILLKMAEKGEIDPKNVDIIDVTDKFLRTIATTPKETLRLSGKVIFHAAVLLRLKAEALLSEANTVINPVVDDFLDFDDEGGPILYDSAKQEVGRQLTFKDLEGAIVRRAQRKKQPVRERKVTLEQLIAALKEAEKLEKVRQEKKPKNRIDLSGYHEVHEMDDILELAHDEDIEDTIIKIEQWLASHVESGQQVELFDLVIRLNKKRDWVEAFLAALFLSNAGKIDLQQEIFYGPLYLSICSDMASNLPLGSAPTRIDAVAQPMVFEPDNDSEPDNENEPGNSSEPGNNFEPGDATGTASELITETEGEKAKPKRTRKSARS